jgi:hypothetical protein
MNWIKESILITIERFGSCNIFVRTTDNVFFKRLKDLYCGFYYCSNISKLKFLNSNVPLPT